jgi:protein O-GlcNAc transferase
MQAEQKQTGAGSSQRASTAAALQAATAHHRAGRLAQAEAIYQEILQSEPNNADALHMLGLIAAQLGSTDTAIALFKKATAAKPSDPAYHCNLGLALQTNGRLDEAAESFRKAISLKSNYAAYHNNLGSALLAIGQYDAAINSFSKAIALQRDFVGAHNNLGNVFVRINKLSEAAASYRRALSFQSDHVEALSNLGGVLCLQGKLEESMVSCRRALELSPGHAQAHNNLGLAFQAQLKFEDAIVSYRQAISLSPGFADAHNNLGQLFESQGNLHEAMICYQQTLLLNPNHVAAHTNLGNVLVALGQLDAAAASYRKAIVLNPDDATVHSNYLVTAQFNAAYSQAELLRDSKAFAQRFEAPLRNSWPRHNPPSERGRKLKIGFVSGDLGDHPVGFFLEGLLTHIDRQQLDIVMYPTAARNDALTRRIRDMGFSWHTLVGVSDEDAVELIRSDGIDILIDLSGHTAHNRLPLFARKPAPVQVAWLGYFATTGLQAMDYILVDRYGVTAEDADFYVEKPWYLPDTRLCFTPPQDSIPVAALPALDRAAITFGCLNNLTKMGDEVVEVWAQVLLGVPGSRLLLKTKQLNDEVICEATRARFAERGVAADRLILEGHSTRIEHLATYNRVDIALDPFPFPGGTTSIEGLWMGVPLVTRRGDRMVTRQGEGILHNLELSDWIAEDDKSYVNMAIAYANNIPYLVELRTQLRERLLASPLCDARRFARNFEEALLEQWETYIDNTR